MNNSNDFRVGFQPFQLKPPADTPKGLQQYKWTLEKCEKMGARAISLTPNFYPTSPTKSTLTEMADMAKEKDVTLILYPFAVWGLAGLPLMVDGWGRLGFAVGASKPGDIPNAKLARSAVETDIKMAEILGSEYFCSGYGHLNIATSRYNKEFPFSEQKKFIVANLKEMAKMLEGTNITFAYENHCDFIGKEIASILEEVGSPHVMSLYDFGNAAVVCADPNEDIEYLAPYTVAAHFKDFKVIMNPHRTEECHDMPMVFTGCYLGEGFIDFERILQAIIEKSPKPKGMPLLAEPAFQLPINDEEKNDRDEFHRKVTSQYVSKMLEIVQKF